MCSCDSYSSSHNKVNVPTSPRNNRKRYSASYTHGFPSLPITTPLGRVLEDPSAVPATFWSAGLVLPFLYSLPSSAIVFQWTVMSWADRMT